jgi:hypothetical protein
VSVERCRAVVDGLREWIVLVHWVMDLMAVLYTLKF